MTYYLKERAEMASNSNMGCQSSPEDKLGLDQASFPGEPEFPVKGKAPA